VGNYPNRLEAEDGSLRHYQATAITPWEAASGTGAVQLPEEVPSGAIRFKFDGQTGKYDLHVRYFDEQDGVSQFKLFVGGRLVDEWKADYELPTPTVLPDAHSSNRRSVRGLSLEHGDEIRVEGAADGGERAAVDYLEVLPSRNGAQSH
jgi:alpha-glucuronidase